jgi:diacylglycerol kinase (ATP)
MRTAIVVNLVASTLRKKPELADQISALAAAPAAVHLTRSLEELEAAAQEIARAGSERVILCGGDGTFMGGVTALERAHGGGALPEIVLAPGGTVAIVAKNWGQRAGLVETVRRALAVRPGGKSELRPTLRVTDDSGSENVGFIFGTGLVARFFDRYYASGGGGNPTAAKIVARIFIGSFIGDDYARSVLEPMPCVLEVDGRTLAPPAYSLIVCSVVRDLGLHLWVTHRAGEDPQRPHLVASPLPTRKLGPQALRVFAGKPLLGADNFDGLAGSFTLRFPREGPYVLDGDVLRARAVTVSAGPQIRVRTFERG